MNDSDSFFGSAKSGAGSESRPRALNPVTGKVQDWQRASNYASPLDNPHGLIVWKLRELIKGLSQRPDLARMLLTGAAIEDNAKADEIIASAHAVAGIDAKANEGTAVHTALSRSFLGHQVPAEYDAHVRTFAAELQRNGLTPVATEVRLLCVLLGVLGHTDWIVKTVDGRYLILDVKTGKLGDAKRKFAVQCKAYAGAEYIDDGNGNWIPIPFTIDQTEAILAHVDPETGATALYRVDLVLGFYGATLAETVRNWHKIEVLAPYVPVHHAVPSLAKHVEQRVDAKVLGSQAELAAAAHVVAPDGTLVKDRNGVDFVCRFDGKAASAHPINVPGQFHCISPEPKNDVTGHTCTFVGDPSCPMCVPQNAVVGTLEVSETRPASAAEALGTSRLATDPAYVGHAVAAIETWTGAKTVEQAQASAPYPGPRQATDNPEAIATGQALNQSVEAEREELMKPSNDKPKLQALAKSMGLADLAHNRAWLADWIIATRRGLDSSAAVMYAKSKGTMAIGGAASFSVPPPSDDQLRSVPEAGDLSFIFKSIEGAKSEGALLALRDNVVERRGDQAWTDEMAEAARIRSMEIAAQSPVNPHAHVLAAIAAATEPQHIALMWSETTLNGSAPESWTPEFKDAADRRLHEIQAAQGSPPANPYGPQQ